MVAATFVLGASANATHGAAPELPKTAQPGELGRMVNPFIGTGGVAYVCGNEFPGATVPLGMMRLSPDTFAKSGGDAMNSSGYYYRDERMLGFSHTRLSGTGATDGGNFLVVPAVAPFTKDTRRLGLDAPLRPRQGAGVPRLLRDRAGRAGGRGRVDRHAPRGRASLHVRRRPSPTAIRRNERGRRRKGTNVLLPGLDLGLA